VQIGAITSALKRLAEFKSDESKVREGPTADLRTTSDALARRVTWELQCVEAVALGVALDYLLDNAWKESLRRNELQEQFCDPATHRRLESLGSLSGWRCLEVGAGAGSIAKWLCNQVGARGRVLAVDLDTRHLSRLSEPNLQIQQANIVSDDLPEAVFDLVHTRLLLLHLPEREAVVSKLIRSVRPGGWLLMEERELALIPCLTTPECAPAWRAFETAMRAGGVNPGWAHTMPDLLHREGLVKIGAEGEVPLFTGGTSMASFWCCIHEGLVGGEGFAVDASLIKADANKHRSIPGAEWNKDIDPERARRAVKEYLTALDDPVYGAASEVMPKFVSPSDPAARCATPRSSPTPTTISST